jgi:hypothetical protein
LLNSLNEESGTTAAVFNPEPALPLLNKSALLSATDRESQLEAVG